MDPHICIIEISLILNLKVQFSKGLKPALEQIKKMFRMDVNLETFWYPTTDQKVLLTDER